MHANWQCPYPTTGVPLGTLGEEATAGAFRKCALPSRDARRDRFDYRLIFAVSLVVFAWLGLLERCNPSFWLSRRDGDASSLWSQATRGAHHYATMAFQG